MNKNDMISAIAEKTGLTKKDAGKALLAFEETVVETLKAEGKVALVGFGTFEVRARKEREAKVPQTGESIMVPACKAPAFKPSKSFKDAVK